MAKQKKAAKPKPAKQKKGAAPKPNKTTAATAADMMGLPSTPAVRSIVKELANLRKDAQAVAGDMGALTKKFVEEKHGDKKALGIARSLAALSDKKLAITLPHLLRYIDDLGLEERAKRQGTMFAEEPGDGEEDGETDDGQDGEEDLRPPHLRNSTGGNGLRPIGEAATSVAEQVGDK